jgi:anti-anti-sigma factor
VAQFEARTSVGLDSTTVALVGECDLSVRDELTAVLTAAIAGSRELVVDLRDLTFLDSSGIHALVTAYQAAQREGIKLYLVNAAGVVAEVLELTGVGDLMRAPDDSDGDEGLV